MTLINIMAICIDLIYVSRTLLDDKIGNIFEIGLAAAVVLLAIIE